MKKIIAALLLIAGIAWSDTGFSSTIQVTETDNSPRCQAGLVKVTAGTLTCNGQTATITTGGGGGGGGSSTLEMFAGATRSSPTVSISLNPNDFSARIHDSTTFYFALNPATTNYIHNQTTSQSATFNVSSGTVSTQLNIPYIQNVDYIAGSYRGYPVLFSSYTSVATSTGVFVFRESLNKDAFSLILAGVPEIAITDDLLDITAQSDAGGSVYGTQVRMTCTNGTSACTPTGGSFSATTDLAAQTGKGVRARCFGPGTCNSVYSEGGTGSGANIAGRFLSTVGTGNNYGLLVNASGGSNNYGLSITSGQVYIASSMTVVSAVSISSGLYMGSSAGTSGQVLTSAGAGQNPTWTTVSASGGSSSLAVGTGTSSGWPTSVLQSSPTAVILFDSNVFTGQLQGGATYFAQINFSSITAIGIPQVSGNLTLSGSTFGVPLTDISTGTNLTVSGNAVLSGDNIGVPITDISTGTNLTITGNLVLSGDNLGVPLVSLSTGVTGTLPYTNIATSTRSFVWDSSSLQTSESSFCSVESTQTVSNIYLTRACDDTTREYMNGYFRIPANFDTSGQITITISGRSKTAASSKNTAWRLEHIGIASTEQFGTAYLFSESGDKAVSATQGAVDQISWTMSSSSSTWAANDEVLFRVSRDPAATNDLTGDYYVKGFTIDIPTK